MQLCFPICECIGQSLPVLEASDGGAKSAELMVEILGHPPSKLHSTFCVTESGLMPLPPSPCHSELTCCGCGNNSHPVATTPASLHFSVATLSWITRSKSAERSAPSSASGTSLPVLWWDNSKMGSTWLLRRFPKGIDTISLLALFLSLFLSPTSLLYLLETLPHKLLGPKSCLSEEKVVFQSSSVWLFLFKFLCIWLCWVFIAAHRPFSSWGERGSSLVGVQGPVIEVASLVEHRLSNCSEWA